MISNIFTTIKQDSIQIFDFVTGQPSRDPDQTTRVLMAVSRMFALLGMAILVVTLPSAIVALASAPALATGAAVVLKLALLTFNYCVYQLMNIEEKRLNRARLLGGFLMF